MRLIKGAKDKQLPSLLRLPKTHVRSLLAELDVHGASYEMICQVQYRLGRLDFFIWINGSSIQDDPTSGGLPSVCHFRLTSGAKLRPFSCRRSELALDFRIP
jgi:hypothetical protein